MARVFAALDEYRAAIDAAGGVAALPAVLTSAVRDAANGADFTARVRADYGLDAQTIAGEEEARLSYLGATSGRDPGGGPLVVLDIGGGSTELIVGEGPDLRFHVSTQAGVVRQSERHIHHDPPLPQELDALAAEAREIFTAAVPRGAARARRVDGRRRGHRDVARGDRPGARAVRLGAGPRLRREPRGVRGDPRPARRDRRGAAAARAGPASRPRADDRGRLRVPRRGASGRSVWTASRSASTTSCTASRSKRPDEL